jgi:O-antigen ligase
MPVLIAVALAVRQRIIQVALYVIIGIGASAFLFAQSRAGLISALVVSLLYLIQSKRKAIKRLMLLIVVIFIVANAIPTQYMSHWFGAADAETYSTGTAAARLEAWMAGVRMFMDHPLSGVGLGQFVYNANSYAIDITQRRINEICAHNSYIEIAAETGIGGLVLFVALMFFMVANLKKAVKNFTICAAKHASNVAYGLYLGAIGYLVGQFFISAQYRKYLWLMIGLSVAVRRISEVYIIKWQKNEKY